MISVIDIGSNSVRLMLWADGNTLYKRINTTRLGEGLGRSQKLSAEAIERTALAVAEYCAEGRALKADVYAFATAAARSARNVQVLCERIKALCGLEVDIVSGSEEALLALHGALGACESGGIIDIGGASTEICLKENGRVIDSRSLNLGAIRLFEQCGDNAELLKRGIEHSLKEVREAGVENVYAVGGTASTLASVKLGLKEYDGKRIQDLPLSYDEVKALAEKFLSLTAEQRREIPGMDARRADIIAGGALLLSEIMKKMSLKEVKASDRDNLEGYLILRGLI